MKTAFVVFPGKQLLPHLHGPKQVGTHPRFSTGRRGLRPLLIRCNATGDEPAEGRETTSEGDSYVEVTVPLAAAQTLRAPVAISYAVVMEQVAKGIEALAQLCKTPPSLKLTVDFPPERSETRAGTLVSRFENNFNYAYALAARLGVPSDRCKRVGPTVEIRDNVNPQGGGEYLTDDECMVGLALGTENCTGRHITILLNAGVDASTLRQIPKYDTHEGGIVVLLNCALERVSWFSKLGFAQYLDAFSPVYYLKQVPPAGWLLKCAPAPWTVFLQNQDKLVVVQKTDQRPSFVDVQNLVRLSAANVK